jgi:thioredoxin reductase
VGGDAIAQRSDHRFELHTGTEVVGLEGDEVTGLSAAVFRDRATGATHTCPLRHLFLFIGADPNTGWLNRYGSCPQWGQTDDRNYAVRRPQDAGCRPNANGGRAKGFVTLSAFSYGECSGQQASCGGGCRGPSAE